MRALVAAMSVLKVEHKDGALAGMVWGKIGQLIFPQTLVFMAYIAMAYISMAYIAMAYTGKTSQLIFLKLFKPQTNPAIFKISLTTAVWGVYGAGSLIHTNMNGGQHR